ncbi:hypothetical protein C8J57DRAFT_295155 [Mycena rebaudengoi]|nr:hypothetical protein C8J57DRAFT_295155 [Mycena rebaudengoi]
MRSGLADSCNVLGLLIRLNLLPENTLGCFRYRLSLYTRYVVLDAVSPIVGIVFSVIILRIALGISTEDGETALTGAEDIRMSRMLSTGSNHKVHTFDHDVV